MTDKVQELKLAMNSGEIVKVSYYGGSQPGAIREIVPLSFFGKNKIKALCIRTNTKKTFFIEKIEIEDDQALVDYDEEIHHQKENEYIEKFLEKNNKEFDEVLWIVGFVLKVTGFLFYCYWGYKMISNLFSSF